MGSWVVCTRLTVSCVGGERVGRGVGEARKGCDGERDINQVVRVDDESRCCWCKLV